MRVFCRVGVVVHFLILLTSAVLFFAFTFRVVGFVFSLGLGILFVFCGLVWCLFF